MTAAEARHFSQPSERAAADAGLRARFWRKLKRIGATLPLLIPFAEDLLAAYYCAFDRSTPRHVQFALAGALAYFVLPLDSIPDLVPMLGFSDDAAVLAAAIKLVSNHITDEHRAAARVWLDAV
ncbi:MAG: YkvA family protein [Xanthobacteraceae bacterium]|jgi:uncharacterized membrane protein YkvA (DUF1232 family)|uniref:YkvA family protein n=1 Tax=Pseudolabrys sp. TaxID=1960880 RepID=UPI003D0EEEF6